MPEGSPPPEEGGTPAETARPPASDETNWRARALDAESKLASLETETQNLRAQLDRNNADLAREKQSRKIDRALNSANVIDPEVASLMLETMLPSAAANGASPDIASLIQTLRATKPFLFESALPSRPAPSVMSPAISTSPSDTLADLATQARTGDRRSLLNYLRARRAI
ncbi:MAG: hypothetical protein ACREJD_15535 [Phycisphaerales bacterium]